MIFHIFSFAIREEESNKVGRRLMEVIKHLEALSVFYTSRSTN